MQDERADVVVIGGGIVGASTAYYLARRGVQVTLLEKGEIGDEQSSRAWGFVRQQGRDPAEVPLMIAANKLWQGLSAELETDIEWVQAGNLALANDEERLTLLRGWLDVAREHGLDSIVLTPAEIREKIPAIEGSFIGGLFTPSDGHAEPSTTTTALARAAETHGATIHRRCAAEDIEITAGQVSAVRTERGLIQTSTVVCAAGGHSSRIGRMVGLSLPQIQVRATVGETTVAPPVTDIGVWEPTVAFRQRPNGSIYIARGAISDYDITLESFRHAHRFAPNYLKNRSLFRMHLGKELAKDVLRSVPGSPARRHPFAHTVDAEPKPNYETAWRSLSALKRLFPSLVDLGLKRVFAGLIDSTPDAIPVLGEVSEPRGFIFATGFSGHGFAMGPIAGKLLAELITEGQPSLDINAFRYSRFKEGAISKPKNVL